MRDITDTSKICTVQIVYVDSFSIMKCALFPMCNLISLHNQLLELLKVDNLKISFFSAVSDIAKIGRYFRSTNVINTLEHITNLSSFARKRNVVPSGAEKLKTLVKAVLKEDPCKHDNMRLSNWSS